jgi:uncharacterized protein YndB with AHSA1/START domain
MSTGAMKTGAMSTGAANSAAQSNAAPTTRTLVVERVFPHPPEKLWRALTESRLLAQWLMGNDFEPVAGRKFQFRTDPKPNWNGIVDCEVFVVEPLKQLSYSWGVGKSESSAGLQWIVLWTLTPVEGGTNLRMEQSGFGSDQTANYNGAKFGWKIFFDRLERVLGGVRTVTQ